MRMTGAIAIALLALLLTWNCLASDDIELYVIGFDIAKGSPEEANLKNMTAQMGGNYLSAENASSSAELENAFTRSYTGDVNAISSAQALRQKLAGDWGMEGAATGVQNSDWKAVLSLSQDGTLAWRETEGATPGVTRTGNWDFDGTTIILKWAAPKGGQTAWVSTSVKDDSMADGAYTAENAPPGTWSAARSSSSGTSQMGRIQGDWIMKGMAGGVQNSDFTASLTLSPNGNLSWEETKGATVGATRTGTWSFNGTTIVLKWDAPKGGRITWTSDHVTDQEIADGRYTAENVQGGTWSASRPGSQST